MKQAARDLRKNPTESEAVLWNALRANRLDGRKFRREQTIGRFIVDFYCASERLVVEVDGGVHAEQEREDRVRQEALETLGLRFVRVTDQQVMHDLPAVLSAIRQAFGTGSSSPLPHSSPPVGEGPGVGAAEARAEPWPEPDPDFAANDPATRWMRRQKALREASATGSSSPLPHSSPPVGEGPGVGAAEACPEPWPDPDPDFAANDPATRWMERRRQMRMQGEMQQQTHPMEVAR